MTAPSFDDLWRQHVQTVFRQCLWFAAGDRAWARERTFEILVGLASHREVFGKATFVAWLERFTARHCAFALKDGPAPDRDAIALARLVVRRPPSEAALGAVILFGGRGRTQAFELLGLTAEHTPALEQLDAALQRDGWRSTVDAAGKPEAARAREAIQETALSPAELVSLDQRVQAELARAASRMGPLRGVVLSVLVAALVAAIGLFVLYTARG